MEVLIGILKEVVPFIKDWGALIIAGISLLVAIISLFKSSKAQRLQNKVNELELKIKQNELDKIYKSEFESAAREAFVAVENYLKKKSGLDLHGFDLATRALSFEIDKQTGEIKRAPLIAINDLKNESQRNEQDGIRYMLMGFFQGPRNLYQHNHIGSGVSNSISVIIERFIKRCPNVLIAGDRYAY